MTSIRRIWVSDVSKRQFEISVGAADRSTAITSSVLPLLRLGMLHKCICNVFMTPTMYLNATVAREMTLIDHCPSSLLST